jgi:SAM-dependent methyltransferase
MAKPTHMDGPRAGTAAGRRFVSAASERNKEPILQVLERVLPAAGLVLEVGAGTGQHAAHFAPRFPSLAWQPTDVDADMFDSIAAWAAGAEAPNLRPPLLLDVAAAFWPVESAAAVISINMIHIAPWDCCLGLLAGAARILPAEGPLVLYGPFKIDGRHTAPSNDAFDLSLKSHDAAWGVRDLGDVQQAARDRGLAFVETVAMPANNFCVIFRKRGRAAA